MQTALARAPLCRTDGAACPVLTRTPARRKRCVTAVTALSSCSLAATTLMVAAHARPSSDTPPTGRLATRCAVALAACGVAGTSAALAACVTAMITAKLASLASRLGGRITDQLVNEANNLSRQAAPIAALFGLIAVPSPAPAAGEPAAPVCDVTCFNAARFKFLRSDRCVCGGTLVAFHERMLFAFHEGVRSVVACACLQATLVLLFGVATSAATAYLALRGPQSAASAAARSAQSPSPPLSRSSQADLIGSGGGGGGGVERRLRARIAVGRPEEAFGSQQGAPPATAAGHAKGGRARGERHVTFALSDVDEEAPPPSWAPMLPAGPSSPPSLDFGAASAAAAVGLGSPADHVEKVGPRGSGHFRSRSA
jgi:hypothetical protein